MSAGGGVVKLKASTGGTVSVRKISHQVPSHFAPHPPPAGAAAEAAAAAAAGAGGAAAPMSAAPLMSSASQPREWRAPFWDMSAPPGGEARCLAGEPRGSQGDEQGQEAGDCRGRERVLRE